MWPLKVVVKPEVSSERMTNVGKVMEKRSHTVLLCPKQLTPPTGFALKKSKFVKQKLYLLCKTNMLLTNSK